MSLSTPQLPTNQIYPLVIIFNSNSHYLSLRKRGNGMLAANLLKIILTREGDRLSVRPWGHPSFNNKRYKLYYIPKRWYHPSKTFSKALIKTRKRDIYPEGNHQGKRVLLSKTLKYHKTNWITWLLCHNNLVTSCKTWKVERLSLNTLYQDPWYHKRSWLQLKTQK